MNPNTIKYFAPKTGCSLIPKHAHPENKMNITDNPKGITTKDTHAGNANSEKFRLAGFVDKSKDPQYYIDQYNKEPSYGEWFHDNYPQYNSIEQAVGLKH